MSPFNSKKFTFTCLDSFFNLLSAMDSKQLLIAMVITAVGFIGIAAKKNIDLPLHYYFKHYAVRMYSYLLYIATAGMPPSQWKWPYS